MGTTLEEVSAAARQLLDTHQRVSVRAVRRLLGGGSPNVLAAHLRQWRATQAMHGSSEAPAHMVAEIAGVAPRLWALALEEARRHVRADLERLRADLSQASADTEEVQGLLDASEERVAQAADERARAVAAAEALQDRFVATDAQFAHANRQLSDTQAALHRQQIMTEHLAGRIDAADATRAAAQQQHGEEMRARDTELANLRQSLTASDTQLAATQRDRDRCAADIHTLREQIQDQSHRLAEATRQAAVERVLSDERIRHQEQVATLLRSDAAALTTHLASIQQALAARDQDRSLFEELRDALGTRLPEHLQQLAERLDAVEAALAARSTTEPEPKPEAPAP
jgi:chromosome segregation ATPase